MAYEKKYKLMQGKSFNNPDMLFDFLKVKFRFGKEVGSDLDKRSGVGLRCSFESYWNHQGLNRYLVEQEGFSEECIGDSKTFYFTKHGKEKCYHDEGFAQICIKFPFRNHYKGFDLKIMTSIHRDLEEIINLDKLNKYVLTGEK
ncbi:hypothetical protein KAJ87_03695 [Candidatus Pacearchaeota archaeon]|nr:hypothetical protein [Candidatus Pacearchaeota archaeon]